MTKDLENARLRRKVENLSFQVDELKTALGQTWIAPLSLGLTAAQNTLLGLLVHREVATRHAVLVATHRDPATPDDRDPKLIDVMVYHLRRKLRPIRVSIYSRKGLGYYITPEDKALILQFKEDEMRGAA